MTDESHITSHYITLHYITLRHITLHYIRLSLPLWFFRAPSFATLPRSPLRSLSTLFPITGANSKRNKGVEVRRAADGPDALWRLYASQTDAARACQLNAGDLSAHLNGWSGKATGDEPISGWLVRRSGVLGVKRPRDGEGEGDGDGGSADGEGEDDDGTMTPPDEGDIEIMDEKEEESKDGKRNTGSLDAQDDDGDARPTGRLDPATLDGRTVPVLKEMCRQVSN